MTVASVRITVGDATPVLLTPGGADEDNQAGKSAVLENLDTTVTVFVGGPDVTVATGFSLRPGGQVHAGLTNQDPIYGICDTGESAVIACLEVGVG